MFSSTFEYISIIFNPPKRFPRKPTESRQAFLTPWILLSDINSVKPGMPRGRSLCVSLVPETKSWNRCVETNSEMYKLKMSGSKFLDSFTALWFNLPTFTKQKNNFFNCSAPASFALRKACCTSPRPNLCAKGVNSSRPWGTKMQIQSENCVYLTPPTAKHCKGKQQIVRLKTAGSIINHAAEYHLF